MNADKFTALDWCELRMEDVYLWDSGCPTPALEARMRRLVPMIMDAESLMPTGLWPDGDADLSLYWRGGNWSIDVSLYEEESKQRWFVSVSDSPASGKGDVSKEGEGELPPSDLIDLLRSEVKALTTSVNQVNPNWRSGHAGDAQRWRLRRLKAEAIDKAGIKAAVSDGWL